MSEHLSYEDMLAEIAAQPENLSRLFESTDRMLRDVLTPKQILALHRVFLTGCGDSHHASLCAEMAFEALAGLPCEPMTAMQMARYAADHIPTPFPDDPLVVGISVSGSVARTAEAVAQARRRGALVLGLTGNPEGALAKAAHGHIARMHIPAQAQVPGTISYAANLNALLLLAIRLGEIRNVYPQTVANDLRAELRGVYDVMAATIDANQKLAAQLADEYAAVPEFVFTGHGPNYGSALFSAAKIIEASGASAWGQDTEEWAHLQYFCKHSPTPTFVIAPPGSGYSRSLELVKVMKRIGRRVIAVVDSGDTEIARLADAVLPVVGEVREAFSPLVYTLAGELFAAYHSRATGEPPFRDFAGIYALENAGGNIIYTEAVE
ncbi:MAG: SIS domain-containing protein [Caldilineaceae bacterium]|nr:SIS domain-containing protein [Caldilineaceae bacterium]